MSDDRSERTALVLYGSETGNAQDSAEELFRFSQRLRFSSRVSPLDSVKPDVLNSSSVVLIVISTTGQGDLPANSKSFWKQLLRKKLPPTFLGSTRFAIFGLGDSSYPQYNWAALKLDKRLRQLGANPIVDRGEGDEQHPEGQDASFLPWLQSLRAKLLEEFPLPEGQTVIADDILLQPRWLLDTVDDSDQNPQSHAKSVTDESTSTSAASMPLDPATFQVRLDRNDRLTPKEHFQDVRHLVFTTDGSLPYDPGDILTIYPRNHDDDVEQLLNMLKWNHAADKMIRYAANPLHAGSSQDADPAPAISNKSSASPSFREFVATRLDINAIPRRSFFSLIAHFTEDEFQKERLLEFANPEFVDELFDYTTRPRRSILEVLQEFDTLKIPWQWAGAIIPRLRGRQFSIASGGALKGEQTHDGIETSSKARSHLELLVAVVKYRTVIRKIRRGVCTRYIEGLAPGTILNVSLQRGTLGTSPKDLSRPVILVGPGTGLAPIRSLLWERWAWQKAAESRNSTVSSSPNEAGIGPSLLFFGCRSEQADYFFKEEWQTLQKLGMPLEVLPAFSRDQKAKVYVQDRIREHKELVYQRLVNEAGHFFLCGSSGRMPQAVRGALLSVIQDGGGLSPEEAEVELKRIEKSGQYKQETW